MSICVHGGLGGGCASANTRGYLICIPSEPGGGPSFLCGNVPGASTHHPHPPTPNPRPRRKRKRRGYDLGSLQPELKSPAKQTGCSPEMLGEGREPPRQACDAHETDKARRCGMEARTHTKGTQARGIRSGRKTRQTGRATRRGRPPPSGGQISACFQTQRPCLGHPAKVKSCSFRGLIFSRVIHR